ncbi:MAG: hypothetical protein PHH13_04290 [Candidatus Peribacteraceae bacterium]|nr:hypothetical protein [Candidatus Peribacteraceae bacterium]
MPNPLFQEWLKGQGFTIRIGQLVKDHLNSQERFSYARIEPAQKNA